MFEKVSTRSKGLEICGNKKDYYICTREPGHEGEHRAHVNKHNYVLAWTDEEQPSTEQGDGATV